MRRGKRLKVSKDIKRLKEFMKNTFEAHCETGLSTFNFDLVDNVVENLESLEA